jgi:predicted O-methyltransferase YrrM
MGVQIDEVRQNAAALVWYLRRPSLHREMLRRLVRNSTGGRRPTSSLLRERDEATRWCRDVQTDFATIAAALGVPEELESVAALNPRAWVQAQRTAERCTVPMGGPGHLDVIYHLARHLQPKTVVETGVAFGWSSLAILLALERSGSGRLLSVDMPYRTYQNDAWVGCVVPQHLRGRWKLLRQPDRDALPRVVKVVPTIDLAHYDSDKTYEGRMFAYSLLYRHLSKGGVLMSDDIDDNCAFRDFAREEGLQPFVIRRPDDRFAGILQKRVEARR